MSIKDLFNKKTVVHKNNASASVDVESTDYLLMKAKEVETFLPAYDFATASNFVKFGSAEQYYASSIERVYKTYPYDGSLTEQLQFTLSSSYLDRWLVANKYPKSTGYAILNPSGYGTASKSDGYGLNTSSGDYEYIFIGGGVHVAPDQQYDISAVVDNKTLHQKFQDGTFYEEDTDRNSTFGFNPLSGSTFEFWLKKDGFNPANTEKEVIFDLWNGNPATSVDYGRITLELSASADGADPVRLTYQSGSVGVFQQSLGAATFTTASVADGNWHHYAVSVFARYEAPTAYLDLKLYRDGIVIREQSVVTSKMMGRLTDRVDGFIGCLIGTPSGSTGQKYAGKLSASVDEFRFWKKRMDSKEIYNNWYHPIGGGGNTDQYRKHLGLYYKFNEGITQTSSVDSVVMDYSGRVANATWTGYSPNSRNTGSCFVSASVLSEEPADLIIRYNNPDVQSLITEMRTSGSLYDNQNTSYMFGMAPSWMQEKDLAVGDSNLKKLYQIMASYFDTIYTQISVLPNLKEKRYFKMTEKPYPFVREILESSGLIVPDLFVQQTILEKFYERDDQNKKYSANVDDIKSRIYYNIYNNIKTIYESKGTEKSYRNLLRCFGVDDEIIKLNLYTDNGVSYLTDKTKHTSYKTKFLNSNTVFNYSGRVFNTSSAGNARTFISGSGAKKLEQNLAFTLEADILIPAKKTIDEEGFFATDFLSASIMGFHEANPSNPADFTWHGDDYANLQVHLVRREINSKDAKFVITNKQGNVKAETDFYKEIYDNERWSLGLKVYPTGYPFIGTVATASNPTYTAELYGVTQILNEVKQEFTLTATIDYTTGSAILCNAKRFYAGCEATNFTGSALNRNDVKIASCRLWYDKLENSVLKQHNRDASNYGHSKIHGNPTPYVKNLENVHIASADVLAFNWDFQLVTGSDANGAFTVADFSSGSSESRYGWIDELLLRENQGKGLGYATSSSGVVTNEFIFSSKKELPEMSFTSDNVFIKGQEEELFGEDEDISDNVFAFEKSMYQVVSEEILNTFSTVTEYANLFMKPVDRYREEYKRLDHFKELYFKRVDGDFDFERFTNYYKFLDSTISTFIQQLHPAMSKFNEGISDMVESHILERPQYQRKFPFLTTRDTVPDGKIVGAGERLYNWRTGHAPNWKGAGNFDENDHCIWQRERAEKPSGAITGSAKLGELRTVIVSEVDGTAKNLGDPSSGRPTIYQGSTYAVRSFGRQYKFSYGEQKTIHSGINYGHQKNRDYVMDHANPLGPKSSNGIPQNVMVIGAGVGQGILGLDKCEESSDAYVTPNYSKAHLRKAEYNTFGITGRYASTSSVTPKSDDVEQLATFKGHYALPFNIVSGTISDGYNSRVSSSYKSTVVLTNLHSDTTTPSNEIPLQSPFTETWVGGRQFRHVPMNRYNSTRTTTIASEANGEQPIPRLSYADAMAGLTTPLTGTMTNPTFDNNECSIAFWFYAGRDGSIGTVPYPFRWQASGQASNRWNLIQLSVGHAASTARLFFDARGPSSTSYTKQYEWALGSSTPIDQWSHFVFKFDMSNAASTPVLYLNGTASSAPSANYTYAGAVTAFDRIAIGDLAGNPFDNRLQDLSVWKKGLTSADVAVLYNDGHSIHPDHLNLSASSVENWWLMGDEEQPLFVSGATFQNEYVDPDFKSVLGQESILHPNYGNGSLGYSIADGHSGLLRNLRTLDGQYTRPEGFRLLFGDHPDQGVSDGALGIVGPDYGGPYPHTIRQSATRYRGDRIKRPINIENINHHTGSALLGNYQHNYEVVNTIGRTANNLKFRQFADVSSSLPAAFNVLPATTHPMTLMGVVPYVTGNLFGIGNSNINAHDQRVEHEEVVGKFASGSFALFDYGIDTGNFASGSFAVSGATVLSYAQGSVAVSGSTYPASRATGEIKLDLSNRTISVSSGSLEMNNALTYGQKATARLVGPPDGPALSVSTGSLTVNRSTRFGSKASGSLTFINNPILTTSKGHLNVNQSTTFGSIGSGSYRAGARTTFKTQYTGSLKASVFSKAEVFPYIAFRAFEGNFTDGHRFEITASTSGGQVTQQIEIDANGSTHPDTDITLASMLSSEPYNSKTIRAICSDYTGNHDFDTNFSSLGTSDFTLSFWYKPYDFHFGSSISSNAAIYFNGTTKHKIDLDTDVKITIEDDDGHQGTVTYDTNFSDNSGWKLLTFVFRNSAYPSGDYAPHLYVNNVSQSTSIAWSPISYQAGDSLESFNGVFRFRFDDGNANGPAIHDLTFWDQAFDQADVTELYDSGHWFNPTKHTKNNTIISYWKMGDETYFEEQTSPTWSANELDGTDDWPSSVVSLPSSYGSEGNYMTFDQEPEFRFTSRTMTTRHVSATQMYNTLTASLNSAFSGWTTTYRERSSYADFFMHRDSGPGAAGTYSTDRGFGSHNSFSSLTASRGSALLASTLEEGARLDLPANAALGGSGFGADGLKIYTTNSGSTSNAVNAAVSYRKAVRWVMTADSGIGLRNEAYTNPMGGNSSFSVSFWARLDGVGSSSWKNAITFGSTANHWLHADIHFLNDKLYIGQGQSSTAATYKGNCAYADGSSVGWKHITATFYSNMNTTPKVWINGDPKTISDYSPPPNQTMGSIDQIFVGSNDRSNYELRGSLCDLVVWNTELTDEDAMILYNSGSTINVYAHPSASVIQDYWRLGDEPNTPAVGDDFDGGGLASLVAVIGDHNLLINSTVDDNIEITAGPANALNSYTWARSPTMLATQIKGVFEDEGTWASAGIVASNSGGDAMVTLKGDFHVAPQEITASSSGFHTIVQSAANGISSVRHSGANEGDYIEIGDYSVDGHRIIVDQNGNDSGTGSPFYNIVGRQAWVYSSASSDSDWWGRVAAATNALLPDHTATHPGTGLIEITASTRGVAYNKSMTANGITFPNGMLNAIAGGTNDTGAGHHKGFRITASNGTVGRFYSSQDISSYGSYGELFEGVYYNGAGTPKDYYISSTGSVAGTNGDNTDFWNRLTGALEHFIGTQTGATGSVINGGAGLIEFTGSFQSSSVHDMTFHASSIDGTSPSGLPLLGPSPFSPTGYGIPPNAYTANNKLVVEGRTWEFVYPYNSYATILPPNSAKKSLHFKISNAAAHAQMFLTGGYASGPDHANKVSFSYWVKTDSIAADDKFHFTLRDVNGGLALRVVGRSNDLKVQECNTLGQVRTHQFNNVLTASAWHNFTITCDKSDTATVPLLWKNGIQRPAPTTSGTGAGAWRPMRKITIGDSYSNSINMEAQASFQDFVIWNTDLDGTDASAVYNGGSSPNLLYHASASAIWDWWLLGEEPEFSSISSGSSISNFGSIKSVTGHQTELTVLTPEAETGIFVNNGILGTAFAVPIRATGSTSDFVNTVTASMKTRLPSYGPSEISLNGLVVSLTASHTGSVRNGDITTAPANLTPANTVGGKNETGAGHNQAFIFRSQGNTLGKIVSHQNLKILTSGSVLSDGIRKDGTTYYVSSTGSDSGYLDLIEAALQDATTGTLTFGTPTTDALERTIPITGSETLTNYHDISFTASNTVEPRYGMNLYEQSDTLDGYGKPNVIHVGDTFRIKDGINDKLWEFVYPYNNYETSSASSAIPIRFTGSGAGIINTFTASIKAETLWDTIDVSGQLIELTCSVTGTTPNAASGNGFFSYANLMLVDTNASGGTDESGIEPYHISNHYWKITLNNDAALVANLVPNKDMSPFHGALYDTIMDGVQKHKTMSPPRYDISITGSAAGSNGSNADVAARIKKAVLHHIGTKTGHSGSININGNTLSFTGSITSSLAHNWAMTEFGSPAGGRSMFTATDSSEGGGWLYFGGVKQATQRHEFKLDNAGAPEGIRLTWPASSSTPSGLGAIPATGSTSGIATRIKDRLTSRLGSNYTFSNPTYNGDIVTIQVTASARGPSWNGDLIQLQGRFSKLAMSGGYDAFGAFDDDWLLLANSGSGNHLFKLDNNGATFPSTLPNKTHEITVTVNGADYTLAGGLVTGSNYAPTAQANIVLVRGSTYKFMTEDASNSTHLFSLYDSKGQAFSSGVTTHGSAGTAGSYTQFVVPVNADDRMSYDCASHSGKGGNIYVLDATAHSSVDCTLNNADRETTWKNITSSINAVFPRLNAQYDKNAANDRSPVGSNTSDGWMPEQIRARIEFTGSTNSGSYDDTIILTSGSSWSSISHVTGAMVRAEGVHPGDTFSIFWGVDPINTADGTGSLYISVADAAGNNPLGSVTNTYAQTYLNLTGTISTGSAASGAGWEHTSSLIWNAISQSLKETGQYTFTTSSTQGAHNQYKIFYVTSSYYSPRFNRGATSETNGFVDGGAGSFDIRTQMTGGTYPANNANQYDNSSIEFSSSQLGVVQIVQDINGFRKPTPNITTVYFKSSFGDSNAGRQNLWDSFATAIHSLTNSAGQQVYNTSLAVSAFQNGGHYHKLIQITASVTGSDKNWGYTQYNNSPSGYNSFVTLNDDVDEGVTHVPTLYWPDYHNVKPAEQKTFDEGVRQKTIITSRFSAPGGPEVQTESFLDVHAKEFSVHNAIPFRNLLIKNDSGDRTEVRETFLKALHSSDEGASATSTNNTYLGSTATFDSNNRNFNVSFWVKLDAGNFTGKERIVYSGGSVDGRTNTHFKDDKIIFSMEDGSNVYKEWSYTFPDFSILENWTHIVITWNKDWVDVNATKLYVNGFSKGSMSGQSTGNPSGNYDTTNDFYFFNHPIAPGSAYGPSGILHGALAEFTFWQDTTNAADVLTLSDVEELYNGGGYIDPTTLSLGVDLRRYYRFGDPDGTGGDAALANSPIGTTNLGGFSINQAGGNYTARGLACGSAAKFNIVAGPFSAFYTKGTNCIGVNSHANRREGLNTLHSRHVGRAGVDSKHGTVDDSDFASPVAGGQYEASFHKIHRNTLVRPVMSGSNELAADETEVLTIVEKRNNFYYQSQIPASDYNYSWVTSSLGNNYSVRSGKQKVFGYWPKDGMLMINPVTASSGIYKDQITGSTHVSAINFPSASQIVGS